MHSSQEATAISIAGGCGRALESPGSAKRNRRPPITTTIARTNRPMTIFRDIAIPRASPAAPENRRCPVPGEKRKSIELNAILWLSPREGLASPMLCD
jgi:hypothetical protein